MTGHTVYDKCKSRELIAALNKKGAGNYVLASSINEGSPLPSNFLKGHFSICAFDNFDHSDFSSLSGTHSDHE